MIRDALPPTEAAKAAWEEFDPGYSPYQGKADAMKALFFTAYAAAEAGSPIGLELLEELRQLAREHVEYDTRTTRAALQRARPRPPRV